MPKYYCDYCDTFLTHDSPSVRKTHNNGRKHKEGVRLFYQQWMEEQAQKLVDATAKAFKEGKMGGNPMTSMLGPRGGAMIPPPAALMGRPPFPGMMSGMPGMPPFPMPGMAMPPGMPPMGMPGMPPGMPPMPPRPPQ